MRPGEPLQQALAPASQVEQYLAMIAFISHAPNQPLFLQPVREFYGAVVVNLEPFGERSHRRLAFGGQALDCQQRLVLMRLDSCFTRSAFAEVQKPPNLVPKVGEGTILG